MRVIHGAGYSNEDREPYSKLVYQNMFMAIQSMIRAMDLLKIEYEDQTLEEQADLIRSIDYETVTKLESKRNGAKRQEKLN